ncbi:MAG: hypothetical protein ACRD11_06100, partial [Terriglobia bacterium]
AIRNFVARGGLLISNGEIGLMDGHARWQNEGLLDDVLGIQQKGVRAEIETRSPMNFPSTPGDLNGPKVIPGSVNPTITTGRAEARIAQTPLVIDNSFGAGRSIMFNFWLTHYDKLRKIGENGPFLRLLEHDLAQDGIAPVADVHTSAGQPLRCSEVVGYKRGEVRYLAILPELGCSDVGQKVFLRFPEAVYIYNLRTHRSLGRASSASGKLVNGEPLFFALSAEPIGKLSVTREESGEAPIKAGGDVNFAIHITESNETEAFPDAVHVEVRDPGGKLIGYYGKNLPLINDTAYFSVETALNDQPGLWRVTVREPYTHQTTGATFSLVPR